MSDENGWDWVWERFHGLVPRGIGDRANDSGAPGILGEGANGEKQDAKSAGSHHLTDGEKARILSVRRGFYNDLDAENKARVDRGIYIPHK